MRYIVNNSTNPYFNLALEEYCLKNIEAQEDYFILWQNLPSIIIGKNQNTLQEINSGFVEERKIYTVRRITGGGAVYHDLGNLNFTFVSRFEDIEQIDFKKYVEPIIEALAAMGVKAELSGRNDITVEGKKISGNAQTIYQNRLMHHGTLLFDVNLEDLAAALHVGLDKIQSKGIESVRSRVANIREYLSQEFRIAEFKQQLEKTLSRDYASAEIKLTEEDIAKIHELATEKFCTWQWNYGESPVFTVSNQRRFSGGKVEALLEVEEGIIRGCRLLGDYLGIADVEPVEQLITGTRYDRASIRRVLKALPLRQYFGSIELEELVEVLCG